MIAPIHQTSNQRSRYYPGIVAEPLSVANRWRYLIFFDDGFAQYVKPCSVRMVCAASAEVWRDVFNDSANFIRQYLERYGEKRTLMQAKENQRINTEYQGKWLSARVLRFDGSLVLMQFDNDHRNEWIYLGSTRLWPVYQAEQQKRHQLGLPTVGPLQAAALPVRPAVPPLAMAPPARPPSTAAAAQRPAPVQAVPIPRKPVGLQRRNSVAIFQAPVGQLPTRRPMPSQQQRPLPAPLQQRPLPVQQQQRPSPPQQQRSQQPVPVAEPRHMARKSTVPLPRDVETPPKSASPPQRTVALPLAKPMARLPEKRRAPVKHMNNSVIYVDSDTMEDMAGKMVFYTAKRNSALRRFGRHKCRNGCLSTMPNNLKSYSLLAWPLLSDWERRSIKCTRSAAEYVVYRAPCGRRMRSIAEVHQYLKQTCAKMYVDSFSFDRELHALTAYVVAKCIVNIDVSVRRSGIRAGLWIEKQ